jgi:hypothetical protein
VIGLDPRKPEDIYHEPFLLRPRSDEEIADYDLGFQCGSNGGEPDETKRVALLRGCTATFTAYGLEQVERKLSHSIPDIC